MSTENVSLGFSFAGWIHLHKFSVRMWFLAILFSWFLPLCVHRHYCRSQAAAATANAASIVDSLYHWWGSPERSIPTPSQWRSCAGRNWRGEAKLNIFIRLWFHSGSAVAAIWFFPLSPDKIVEVLKSTTLLAGPRGRPRVNRRRWRRRRRRTPSL